VIQLAAKQDYEAFYSLEMEERRKYQYPPYTFLTNIIVKGMEQKRVEDVALKVKDYLMENIKGRKFNLYGPTIPYIAHINGRYYRTILLKYKNQKEANELLSGIKVLRLANKDVDISIDVDPGSEAI
jgi:primosomal protein N' (replication factor Y)